MNRKIITFLMAIIIAVLPVHMIYASIFEFSGVDSVMFDTQGHSLDYDHCNTPASVASTTVMADACVGMDCDQCGSCTLVHAEIIVFSFYPEPVAYPVLHYPPVAGDLFIPLYRPPRA